MVKPEQVQPASTIEIDNAGEAHNHQPPIKRWLKIVSWVGALLLFLAIYILRLDQVAGLIKDDAWYVLSAKALASGQGYTLINLPSPGTLAFYPPAFPWLLSLVVRFSPQFPQNLWLLKSVSIVAVLGIGIAAYRYFTRERELPPSLALGIAVLTVINPAMAFLATSTVMSECVFTLSQLLTIIVIERYVRAEGSGRAWIYLLSGAALASFTFLTRSVAIGLIAAIVIYLLKERLVRAAVIFAVVVVMCVGPWMLYARRHAPTAAQLIEQNGQNFVYSYTSQFWQKHAGDFTAGTISIGDLPDRIGKNVGLIMGQDIGMMIADLLYRDSRESGTEFLDTERGVSIFSFILSVLAISGYLTVARKKITLAEIVVLLSLIITVIWPWEPFRFILPLLPFMVFYLLMGVGAIYHLSQRWQSPAHPRAPWIAWGMVAGCLLAVNIFDNLTYISKKNMKSSLERPLFISSFDENHELLQWVSKNLPPEEVVVTPDPALVYLYTGHKAIRFWDPKSNWEKWSQLKVRYLVGTSLTPLPVITTKKWPAIYRSGSLNLIVEDFGPVATREAPWAQNPANPPEAKPAP